MKRGIRQAIKFCRTQRGLALALKKKTGWKCTQQMVQYWLKKGCMPPRWVLPAEELTGVPRYELNEKIYPKEKQAA